MPMQLVCQVPKVSVGMGSASKCMDHANQSIPTFVRSPLGMTLAAYPIVLGPWSDLVQTLHRYDIRVRSEAPLTLTSMSQGKKRAKI